MQPAVLHIITTEYFKLCLHNTLLVMANCPMYYLMHCILNCILNSIQLCGTLPIILHTAIHNTLPAAFNTMHYILNSVQLCGALPIVLHPAIHNALPAALTPSYAPYCMQFSIVSTMTCNIYYSICISLIAAL